MFQCYFACSNAILGEIESEARRVSSAAVDSAFKDLRASVFDNEALEESGLDRQGGLTNPRAGNVGQGGGRVPAPSPHIGGGGTHDLDGVVVQPAAFGACHLWASPIHSSVALFSSRGQAQLSARVGYVTPR